MLDGRIGLLALFTTLACGFPRPAILSDTTPRKVGGVIRGLWEGTSAVTLHLHAASLDTRLAVSANGAFTFPDAVPAGEMYTITVDTNPPHHTCTTDASSTGTIGGLDVIDVVIACAGPARIKISGPWDFMFDPSQDVQTFAGSIVTQGVGFTITGSPLTSASVQGSPVAIGTALNRIALPLGPMTVPVALTAAGGISKTYHLNFIRGAEVLDQMAYVKSSVAQPNRGLGNGSSSGVSMSGNTIAVAALGDSSNATGVNGNEADTSAPASGAVYVFVRTGNTWTQQAYIKASNAQSGDGFGCSISLSGDTLAVGALGEDSKATGIGGNGDDNSAESSGAAYVFVRSGSTWTQQAYIKASNSEARDYFGYSVSLSENTLVVGSLFEASAATGVNGDQTNNAAPFSGAAYVFTRGEETWKQEAYIKASNTEIQDRFGFCVSVSGNTLAVGALNESSNATGINGDQNNNTAAEAGAVYVYLRTGSSWTQQAYVKASNAEAEDHFGANLQISGDTMVVASNDRSGFAGNEQDNSVQLAGAVYVFVRDGVSWSQQAFLKEPIPGVNHNFGAYLALSGDLIAIGSPGESSNAVGVNGDQSNADARNSGAVDIFLREGTTWSSRWYVKASNTDANDVFGVVSLSEDTLVIGAPGESSAATGINPSTGQADNSAPTAGAIYIFR